MNQDQQRSQSGRRPRYDEEFKRNAVELLESGERSAVQLGRELGISDCSLGKWKRQYGRQGRAAGSGLGAEQGRIAQLVFVPGASIVAFLERRASGAALVRVIPAKEKAPELDERWLYGKQAPDRKLLPFRQTLG